MVNEYPFVRQQWTGNNFGDVYAGTKVNLLSEHRQQPMAMALRGTVKLPTAGEDNVGTGQFDYFADAVLSKEINQGVELAGFGGFAFRGDPRGVSLSDGFRWGIGAASGTRTSLRLTTELHGEVPTNDAVVVAPGAVVGVDRSVSPILTQLDSRVNLAAGLTWQHPSGMLLGVGMNYRVGLEGESAVGLQLRLGFHSGVRVSRRRHRCRPHRAASRRNPRRRPSRLRPLRRCCLRRRSPPRVRYPLRRTVRPACGRSAIRAASRSVRR